MSIKQTQQTSNLSLAPLGIAVISTSIAGKCVGRSNLVHGLSAEDNGDHDFWTQHFQLDETIRDALSQLVLPTDSRLSIDSNIWLARITLQAAMICLHQAAMKFAKMTQVPAPMVADSPARSMNAALDISTITKQIQSVPLSKVQNIYIIRLSFANFEIDEHVCCLASIHSRSASHPSTLFPYF